MLAATSIVFSPNSVAVRANHQWQLQLSKSAVSDTAERDKDGLLDAIACGFCWLF